MKHRFLCGGRSAFASVLAAAAFALSLTACGKAGELPVSPALRTEAVSSARFGAASSGAESPVSSPAVSSTPVSRASSAAPSSSPAAKKPNGVHTVKKLATFSAAAKTGSLNAAVPGASRGYAKVDQRSGYNALASQGEKNLYGLIGKSIYQVSETKNAMGYYSLQTVAVPSGLSEAQACKTLVAYEDDNPQVFWVANAYSIGAQGGKTYLQLYSNLSLQQCNEYNRKFTEAVSAAVRALPVGLSEFDREEAIFNTVAARCSYDAAAAADPSLWQAYTAYGAFINGKAVCEGYSRAMQLLCGYVGMNCTLVRGTAEGGNHMWNCVEVDGNWYQLDITWCDTTSLIYNYYNITDQVLNATHTPAAAVSSLSDSQVGSAAGFYNLSVQRCDSTLANYYLVKGIRVGEPGGLGDEAVVRALTAQLKAGKGTVVFSVGSNGDFSAAVQDLIRRVPSYLRSAARESGKALNLESIRYLADEPNRGINIIVPYSVQAPNK